ncbi:MAG: sulfur transferase domain-containing protein [Planctomycetota bacterium]
MRLPFHALLLTTLPLAACASFEEQVHSGPERVTREVELDGTLCYRCGHFYLSEEPSVRTLETLERRGVEAVLDLRSPEAGPTDPIRHAAEDFGLEYIQLPIPVDGDLDVPTVDAFVRHAAKLDDRLSLVFCERGTATSMLFAIYRAAELGVDVDVVIEDALKLGLRAGQEEATVRAHVERLRALQSVSASAAMASAMRSA